MRKIAFKKLHFTHSERKGRVHWKAWIALALLIVCVSLVVYTTNLSGYQIKSVVINGAVLTDESVVRGIAEGSIEGKYFFIFPKSFFWLYPRLAIRDQIKEMPTVLDANLHLNRNINTLTITLTERKQKYLWCKPALDRELGDCYYMDSEGFVFTHAPKIEGGIFVTFSGLIDGMPIRQYFLPKVTMSELSDFLDGISKLGLHVKSVNAITSNEVRIALQSGAEIVFSLEKSLAPILHNLSILVASKDFKQASGGVDKVQYIDLRYGSKAFWK